MGMPMESTSPVSFEALLNLRNSAKGQMDMSGAASRRLSEFTGADDQETVDPFMQQTPDDMVQSDMEQGQLESIEPPDIDQSAAKVMMQYGAVQDYLMRARGELSG